MTQITEAQRAALLELIEVGGYGGTYLGIRTSTVRSLEKLGLVTVAWGKRTERMSAAGWTGRVYVENNWTAFITDAGRAAVSG